MLCYQEEHFYTREGGLSEALLDAVKGAKSRMKESLKNGTFQRVLADRLGIKGLDGRIEIDLASSQRDESQLDHNISRLLGQPSPFSSQTEMGELQSTPNSE
jgi:hypothetical protein